MKQNRSLRIKILHQLGPTRMLALSFFALILVATILLCMPFVTDAPSQLSFLDNLFIATSVTLNKAMLTIDNINFNMRLIASLNIASILLILSLPLIIFKSPC